MHKKNSFYLHDHVLQDLIMTFPEAAHLKDIKTKKYIISNKNNLKIYGLNDPNKVVGLTVHDLDEFMKPYWGDGFANQITEFDTYVEKKVTVMTDYERVFLDKFGLVHIQNMTKYPVCNKNGKTSAIFTMSFEITNSLDKIRIFNEYKKIYPKKREACFFFLKYLKIDQFLNEILTEKEIICLLFMLKYKSYKLIASQMHISQKTIETHISNIANKIKSKNLSFVLEFIRLKSHEN